MFGEGADVCCGCTEGKGGISTVRIQEWLLPGGGGRPAYVAVAKKGKQPWERDVKDQEMESEHSAQPPCSYFV